jgi:hypothetical protein
MIERQWDCIGFRIATTFRGRHEMSWTHDETTKLGDAFQFDMASMQLI